MAGQINLYDPSLRKKRDWLSLGNIALGALVLLACVAGAGLYARSDLAELRAQVLALGQKVAERKPDARLEQELTAMRQLAEARGRVLETLRQRLVEDAPPFAAPLRGLANLTMPGIWITGFVWDAAGNNMEIRGRTTDPALLPEYLRRLNREPTMRGQAFAALKVAEGKAEPQGDGHSAGPRLPAFHEFTLAPVKREAAAPVANDGGRG